MKKLLFSVAALVLTTGLFAQEKTAEAPKKKSDDVAKFKTESIDLGKIIQNNPTTAIFEVTNISKEPLLIEQANPTCGCTISDYTKEPIAPGKIGIIKATYNAKNLNMFEKHLTVKFAGCDDMKSITIKGEVIVDPNAVVAPAVAPVAVAPAATPVPAAKGEVLVDKAATTEKTAPAKAPVKKSGSSKSSKIKTP